MEPFCVILKRTMAPLHPLNQILKYHCREVTVPNTFGTPKLVDEAQFMDLLFSHGNTGTMRLLRDAHPLATWDVTDLRAEIKVRLLRLWNVKRRNPENEVDSKRGHPSPSSSWWHIHYNLLRPLPCLTKSLKVTTLTQSSK